MSCTSHHAKHYGSPLNPKGLSPDECWECLQELVQRSHNVLDDEDVPYAREGNELFSLPARIASLAGREGN